MKKQIFLMAFIALFAATSCNESTKTVEETDVVRAENLVEQILINEDGKQLTMLFDLDKGVVTINIDGETAILESQRAASGIWYKNEEYDLSGKGNDIILKKGDDYLFSHQDRIVEVKAENEEGDVLLMEFNNTAGTMKAYLNGGEQLDLVEQKSASGVIFTNEEYELLGKGDEYTLLKNEEVIFRNF